MFVVCKLLISRQILLRYYNGNMSDWINYKTVERIFNMQTFSFNTHTQREREREADAHIPVLKQCKPAFPFLKL